MIGRIPVTRFTFREQKEEIEKAINSL
jgi:hypothetical protein